MKQVYKVSKELKVVSHWVAYAVTSWQTASMMEPVNVSEQQQRFLTYWLELQKLAGWEVFFVKRSTSTG